MRASRTIDCLFFHLKLTLFDDPDEFNSYITKRGYQNPIGTDGCVVFFDGEQHAVVFIDYKQAESYKDIVYTLSVIVHESSHVADDIFSFVGEQHPGGETKAYLIEKISAALMNLLLGMHNTLFLPKPAILEEGVCQKITPPSKK